MKSKKKNRRKLIKEKLSRKKKKLNFKMRYFIGHMDRA